MAKSKSQSEGLPAGLTELTEGGGAAVATEEAPAPPTGFWRVRVHLFTHVEPGAHDHVVRAPDRANAEATFNQEMGVLSIDRAVNKVIVEPATELEFIAAQAKRLRVDLREHRENPRGKKAELLTWAPPGGARGKYKVSETGELTAAE